MIDKSAAAAAPAHDGWFTSSYTNGTGTCVEVRFGSATVLIRDTKHRPPTISVTPTGWSALLNALTAGE